MRPRFSVTLDTIAAAPLPSARKMPTMKMFSSHTRFKEAFFIMKHTFHLTTRQIVFAALMIAATLVLEQLRIFHMP